MRRMNAIFKSHLFNKLIACIDLLANRVEKLDIKVGNCCKRNTRKTTTCAHIESKGIRIQSNVLIYYFCKQKRIK